MTGAPPVDEEPDAGGEGPVAGEAHGPEVAAHLQAAALELIAAVRAALDAAEAAVRDPLSAVAGAAGMARRSRRPPRSEPGGDGGDSGGVQRIPVT
ncbi:MAG: hypothetical protein ABR511_00095 [Acidimicrobiales bacterium]